MADSNQLQKLATAIHLKKAEFYQRKQSASELEGAVRDADTKLTELQKERNNEGGKQVSVARQVARAGCELMVAAQELDRNRDAFRAVSAQVQSARAELKHKLGELDAFNKQADAEVAQHRRDVADANPAAWLHGELDSADTKLRQLEEDVAVCSQLKVCVQVQREDLQRAQARADAARTAVEREQACLQVSIANRKLELREICQRGLVQQATLEGDIRVLRLEVAALERQRNQQQQYGNRMLPPGQGPGQQHQQFGNRTQAPGHGTAQQQQPFASRAPATAQGAAQQQHQFGHRAQAAGQQQFGSRAQTAGQTAAPQQQQVGNCGPHQGQGATSQQHGNGMQPQGQAPAPQRRGTVTRFQPPGRK
eukprot:TRINITY_DN57016_c0_g1_i1.p2 TRINITY_DN57016_c0_g1~~TRINITY_DN57016_c0_g1_i1.p2  ORF type:complete len:397 (+),score=162.01 TRINITY_DN57016_c0_g1_i1:94-1191(+)